MGKNRYHYEFFLFLDIDTGLIKFSNSSLAVH